jgi:MFS superfamily sulfate permease-like transporter
MSRLPVFTWLPGYDRSWIRGDMIAGLTVWAVLVPEALAYATIAGVSPVVGLYAAPGALLLYAAFGSSRHLVVGPMAATAALSAAAVGDLAAQNTELFVQLTITMALTVGMAGLVAGLLRLGFLASFISEPVMKGFTCSTSTSMASRSSATSRAGSRRSGFRMSVSRTTSTSLPLLSARCWSVSRRGSARPRSTRRRTTTRSTRTAS